MSYSYQFSGMSLVVVLMAKTPIPVSTYASGSDVVYLSALTIENFRQFGHAGHGLKMRFNEGVTALVGGTMQARQPLSMRSVMCSKLAMPNT